MSGAALKYLLRSTPVAAYGGVTAIGIASFGHKQSSKTKTTACEGSTLQKRMSSASRLALGQTEEKSFSNPTHLIALVGTSFHKTDFEQLWKQRGMEARHPRFHQKVMTTSTEGDNDNDSDKKKVETTGYLVPSELPVEAYVKEREYPRVYNIDLQDCIESCMQKVLRPEEGLWQVEIAPGGSVGQSGAIPKDRASELVLQMRPTLNSPEPMESLILFSGHPALGDGISLATALTDLCDEAAELKREFEQEQVEAKRKRKLLSWWQRFKLLVHSIYYYTIGSVKAFLYYWNLYRTTATNPFQQVESQEDTAATQGQLTVSWATVAPVDEVENVAASLTKKMKLSINDVMVSCVSAAVARQMQEHQMRYEMDETKRRNIKIPEEINVMIPVHPEDGRLKNNQTVGHRMGALFAPVPSDSTYTAAQRLEQVHRSLEEVQETPFLFWSRFGAKVLSFFPAAWVSSALDKAQPNAACMVTYSQGPSRRLHLGGREVEVLQGFTPLSPGIPIGVVVSSYAGELNISVTAEPWAVPDAEKFLSWVLDEYKFLYTESPVALETELESI